MENEQLAVASRRALKLLLFSIVVFLVLFCRLFWLQIFQHEFFKELSFDQRLRIITLSPDRGDIYDRSGNVLATSIDSYSIGAFPAAIKNKKETADKLAKIMQVSSGSIMEKINVNKPFVWVKRKMDKSAGDKIIAGKFTGINVLPEKKRVYPKNELAAQILGFVGTDNEGLSGLELSYEKYLKGEEGRLTTERDLRGREILTSDLRVLKAPTDGMNITLTIDEPIQYMAEKELKRSVTDFHGISGTVIVMDVTNGEILALASYPSFDPNDYKKYNQNYWVNRAVVDVYEPGSTFKLITVASALDTGTVNKDTKVYCEDALEIGGRVIRNSHKLKFPTKYLSLSEILQESVNIGAAHLSMKMGKDAFYKKIKDFGFGEVTGIGLPGESRGILRSPENWDKPDVAMMAFGQSIAVTPLQLITAISSLARGGQKIKPVLIQKIESPDKSFLKVNVGDAHGRSVSPVTAAQMMKFSEDVVELGTGKASKIKFFRVGGKTGTAQKAKPSGIGYMQGHYISSFIGFFPLTSPKLAILVVVDDPTPVYWGERVAAPVFQSVGEFAARRLNIVPDKMNNSVI